MFNFRFGLGGTLLFDTSTPVKGAVAWSTLTEDDEVPSCPQRLDNMDSLRIVLNSTL